MKPTLLLTEYGPPVPIDLDRDQVAEIRRQSTAIRANLRLPGEPFEVLSAPRMALRARYVAGFVPLRQVTLEIAPKFLRPRANPSWRNAFLNILAVLGRLRWLPKMHAGRDVRSLPDLMGLVVLDGLTRALQEGVPRAYNQRRTELAAVRGQIDAERWWRRKVEPTAIPCRYDEFVEDTPVARLLKWAAIQLASDVSSGWLAGELNLASTEWPQVPPTLPEPRVLAGLRLPPQYGYLEDAVEVSRLLSERQLVSLTDLQSLPGRAFLWNTQRVFEDFALAVVHRAAASIGCTAEKRLMVLATEEAAVSNHEDEWTADRDVKPTHHRPTAVTTEPDICLLRAGKPVGALDAKYKTLRGSPRADDAYQILAAGRLVGCSTVALVYPMSAEFTRTRSWRVRRIGMPSTIEAWPLDLVRMSDRNGLRILTEAMSERLQALRLVDAQG